MKSDIGKRINQTVMDKNILIEFDYSEFNLFDETIKYGEVHGNKAVIFVNNHRNIEEVAQTIIHEVTHIDLGTEVFTQKEEVYCRLQELLHTKGSYDISDIRKTISEVKNTETYKSLSWRDKRGI